VRRFPALAAFLAVPVFAAAQQVGGVAPNRATAYLHPTDVRDPRALWVNPAGLGVLREASVYAEIAVEDPGARGRLRQLSAGFNARGLAFGYQRDVFDGGRRGHTYRLGLAGASKGLAAGGAMALYRGDTKGTGWDVGASYLFEGGAALTVGGVVANIGQPVVRGLDQRLTFIPGATWRPLGPAAALSVHARITPDSVMGYAFGVSWQGSGGRFPIGVLARLDTDGGLRRGAFAVGLSIGGPDRVGAVVSTPGDLSGVDAASLWGLSTREAGAPRRR
jgi:hypothetical protein